MATCDCGRDFDCDRDCHSGCDCDSDRDRARCTHGTHSLLASGRSAGLSVDGRHNRDRHRRAYHSTQSGSRMSQHASHGTHITTRTHAYHGTHIRVSWSRYAYRSTRMVSDLRCLYCRTNTGSVSTRTCTYTHGCPGQVNTCRRCAELHCRVVCSACWHRHWDKNCFNCGMAAPRNLRRGVDYGKSLTLPFPHTHFRTSLVLWPSFSRTIQNAWDILKRVWKSRFSENLRF